METVDHELYGTMATLRAVRRLRPDPIPDDVLTRVVQAACWAPTGGNQQPWRVVVATGEAPKRMLADVYAPAWAEYVTGFMARMEGQPEEVVAPWRRVAAAGDHLADHLHEAPAILVFFADPRRMAITDAGLDRPSMVAGASVYPAVQNALLAARAEGLGCVLTTLHCPDEATVKRGLSVPDEWALAGVVPLGYPVGTGHGPITRRTPDQQAYRDAWGTAWPG